MNGERIVGLIRDKLDGWFETGVSKLPELVLALLVLVAFWLFARGGRAAAIRALARLSDNQAVNRLLATLLYVGLILAGLFFALGVLDLDKTVTSLLAGAGIVGLALAFAFQDAAENLVAGVTVAIRRPFRVGDLVQTNGFEGTVEDINLRSTALRRPQGQLVLIPNAAVFKNPMVNFTETSDRRVDLEVGVSYAEDLERVHQVALAAVRGVPGLNDERAIEVYFTGFGASSIDLVVRFWLNDAYEGSFMTAKSAAILRVKQAFDDAGITIPFPIRTLDFGIRGGATLGEMLPAEGRDDRDHA